VPPALRASTCRRVGPASMIGRCVTAGQSNYRILDLPIHPPARPVRVAQSIALARPPPLWPGSPRDTASAGVKLRPESVRCGARNMAGLWLAPLGCSPPTHDSIGLRVEVGPRRTVYLDRCRTRGFLIRTDCRIVRFGPTVPEPVGLEADSVDPTEARCGELDEIVCVRSPASRAQQKMSVRQRGADR
jgi:hypothetical protein